MNKIYNQRDGRDENGKNGVCAIASTANLYEAKTGQQISFDDMRGYYDKHGLAYDKKNLKVEDGANNAPRAKKVLELLKHDPLKGMQVKEYRRVWSRVDNPSPPLVTLWGQLSKGNFLFVVKCPLKLTEKHFIIPVQGNTPRLHVIAKVEETITSQTPKRFILENTWGPDWGDGGFCYLNLLDLPREVVEIWEVEFD